MKIFGFNAGQLGDLVMCSVVAREFKLQYHKQHLTFCIGKKYEHSKFLFENLPFIDDIHVWDSYDSFPSEIDREFIKTVTERKDYVFNPFPSHTCPDWYNKYHYIQEHCHMNGIQPGYNLHCQLGYKPLSNKWRDQVTLSMFASGNQSEKSLSLENLEKLVKMLIGKGYIPVQIGGKYDKQIPGAQKPDLNLREAIETMNQSRFHITIDTSFSWIASAYNLPVIGLYGRNYKDMFPNRIISHNPINDNAIYLNNETVDTISLDRIEEAINTIK